MATFAERLKTLRLQLDLTQLELAEKIGVNKQTISQYERDVRQPDFVKLEALCDCFNVSTDYLLGKSNVTLRFVNTDELALLSRNNPRRIPVFGMSSSNPLKESDSYIIGYETISESWQGIFSALQVSDDNMSPVIRKGDVVIFRKQEDVENGDVAVAIINDSEYAIGKIFRTGDQIILSPFNPSFEPLVYNASDTASNSVRIIGKVVENRQKF